MTDTSTSGRQLRADARKNIAAILDAATSCLARDPAASISEIAKTAGVGRVTLYGHFESRATLVSAVVDRAMADANAALDSVDLSGDPVHALVDLIDATWTVTYRYGALVIAAERALPGAQLDAAHAEPAIRAERLIERGRETGDFRTDLPTSWLVTILHTVTHAAATAVYNDEMPPDQASAAIAAAMLGVLTPPGKVSLDVSSTTDS